jgi:hypothetical protein
VGAQASTLTSADDDFLVKSPAEAVAFDFKIVARLQVEPEPVGGSEITRETQRRISRDATQPDTISFTRRGGTLMSLARRYWEMPKGFKNSSFRISPG